MSPLENPFFTKKYFFEMKGRKILPSEVIEKMQNLLTKERCEKIERVVSGRTLKILSILDGVHDLGNVSAVMRSAEAYGIQEMHFVENQRKYKLSKRTTKGTDKWLNFIKWKDSKECALHLKERGYQICSTHLDESAVPISEVDFSIPTALVLGNEKDGVSQEILALSDKKCILPMTGFAQSFNISVAGALCFFEIYKSRLQKLGHHGDLSPEEKEYLIADYYLRSSDNPERLFN